MNKELREEMEYLITCDDKAITPDVRDDVKMTLDYIDELEKENKKLKEHKYFTRQDALDEALDRICKAIEYIKNCEWEDYPIQTTTHHKLREDIMGKKLLNILKGEEK